MTCGKNGCTRLLDPTDDPDFGSCIYHGERFVGVLISDRKPLSRPPIFTRDPSRVRSRVCQAVALRARGLSDGEIALRLKYSAPKSVRTSIAGHGSCPFCKVPVRASESLVAHQSGMGGANTTED